MKHLVLLLLVALLGACNYNPPRVGSENPKASEVRGKAIDGSEDTANPGGGFAGGVKPLPEGVALEELKKSAPAPKAPEGYVGVTFDKLASYPFEVDELGRVGELPDGSRSKVPDEILSYDGKKVAVSGYMVPLSLEEQEVKDFVLVRNQLLCCYGQAPKLNEWIYIALDDAVPVQVDLPITVAGDMEVGEDLEGEQILSLYRMLGHSVEVME